MNMKFIKSFFGKFTVVLVLVLMTLLAPSLRAATLVPLSAGARDAFGYTHKATITYADVAAFSSTASNATVAIFPGSGVFPAGFVIQDCAINVVTGFTNSTANNTNLLLYVGGAESTNRFFSGIELDARNPPGNWFATNAVAVYNATNRLNATFRLTGAAAPTFSTMGVGEVEIYFRAFNLNKLENE